MDFTDGGIEGPLGFRFSRQAVKVMMNGGHAALTIDLKSAVPVQELAENYKGGLLLFTGAMDKTVNPANTFRLADALIKAGKDFDMFVLPESTHGFFGESELFFEHKMWRHFARHLLGDNSADFETDLNKEMVTGGTR